MGPRRQMHTPTLGGPGSCSSASGLCILQVPVNEGAGLVGFGGSSMEDTFFLVEVFTSSVSPTPRYFAPYWAKHFVKASSLSGQVRERVNYLL